MSLGVPLLFLSSIAGQLPNPPLERPILVTVDDLPIIDADRHDTPSNRKQLTEELLAALAKHQIRAVGLVTLSRLRSGDGAILESWLAAGHELGNHSHGHLDLAATSTETYIADAERGRRTLERLTGRPVRFFRYPFLSEGETEAKLRSVQAYLRSSGQQPLPVTIDDQDWSFEPRYHALRTIDGKLPPEKTDADRALTEEYLTSLRMAVVHHERRGDDVLGRRGPQILLLHAGEVGAKNWDALFTWLEQTGHRFATAEEVLSDPAFLDPDGSSFVGALGISFWDRIRVVRRTRALNLEIAALLADQAAAWNRGDVPAFCSAYTDDATFVSPSGVTRGRAAIRDRYEKKYSTRELMGSLTLEILETRLHQGFEISRFGDAEPSRVHGATAVLAWKLAYTDRPMASGWSMISLVPTAKGWRITQDASM
ncbi:MAG: SgcJ/EcaC family oxidoreductase [Deltaproteobacteria bacterium]|nr:SgcJ/EcaC family oxidoreductase [Deltaproteobacteria bacterium]